MPDPIKIVVTADVNQAVQQLETVPPAVQKISVATVEASKHAVALGEGLAGNRMALMELGHVARATGEGLAAGMSPMRVLALESPRIVQALSTMGINLAKLGPYAIAAAAAAGVFALEWHAVMGGVEDTTKKTEEMISALDKVPAILEKIQLLGKAGLISPAAANEFADELNGKIKLYKDPAGNITREAQHTAEEPTYSMAGSGVGGGPSAPTGTRTVTRDNPPATQDEIIEYQKKQMPMVSEEQTKAAAKFKDLMDETRRDTLTGIEKINEEIHERYQKERDEITLTAAQAGKLIGPGQQQAAVDRIKDLDAGEAAEKQLAAEKYYAEQSRKEQETLAQWEADKRKITEQQDKALEDAITAHKLEAKDKAIGFYEQEYDARISLYQSQLDAGVIDEQQFTDKITIAQKERLAGEKAYQAELQHTALLKSEIARAETEGKLHAVQGNPLLTDDQKAQQSIPLIQQQMAQNETGISHLSDVAQNSPDESARLDAEKQLTDLMVQQVDLQNQMQQLQGRDSFIFQLTKAMADLHNAGGTIQEQTAAIFTNTWNTAINSVSKGITGLIMGTTNLRTALLGIAQSVVGELVQSFVHMGTVWVTQHVLMAAATKLLALVTKSSSQESTLSVIEDAIKAITAKAASAAAGAASAESSIPYVGPALGVAAGASMMATVLGYAAGFSGGGYTGDGGMFDPAGIVHRGEFVFNSAAVDRIGVDALDAMHRGAAPAAAASGGGSGLGGGNSLPTKIVNVFDRQSLIREMKNPDYAHVIVNHVMNNKRQMGFQT